MKVYEDQEPGLGDRIYEFSFGAEKVQGYSNVNSQAGHLQVRVNVHLKVSWRLSVNQVPTLQVAYDGEFEAGAIPVLKTMIPWSLSVLAL